MITPIVLIAAIVIFAVIALYLVMLLKRIQTTVESVNDILKEIKAGINPIMDDTHELLKDVKVTTQDINGKLEKTNELFEAVEALSGGLKLPAKLAGELVESASVQLASAVEGVKEGFKKYYEQKKEEKNSGNKIKP